MDGALKALIGTGDRYDEFMREREIDLSHEISPPSGISINATVRNYCRPDS